MDHWLHHLQVGITKLKTQLPLTCIDPCSLALGVKMNVLLFLPGLLVLLFTHNGVLPSVIPLASIALVQIFLAAPFLTSRANAETYFAAAFNFSREFLWEWTVNWRWLGEEAFVSKGLHSGLLAAHVAVIVLFAFRWCADEGGVLAVLSRGLRRPTQGPAYGRPSADRTFLPCHPRDGSGPSHADITLLCVTNRRRRDPLLVKRGRDPLCTLAALPVLCVVRASDGLHGLAHPV